MSAIDDVLQQLAQFNAHFRNLVKEGVGNSSDFYNEARRTVDVFLEKKYLRWRPSAITISKNITGAGTAAAGSNDFRISPDEDFIVFALRGFVGLNDLASEPVSAVAGQPTTFVAKDRAFMKAVNCRATILDKDTKVPYTESEGILLSSICPELGGRELKFMTDKVPGIILPANKVVQVQFALQSANAMFNTASTDYGIVLQGAYLNRNRA